MILEIYLKSLDLPLIAATFSTSVPSSITSLFKYQNAPLYMYLSANIYLFFAGINYLLDMLLLPNLYFSTHVFPIIHDREHTTRQKTER
jgi:hypothetical protein